MARFDQVTPVIDAGVVQVGAGLVWDDVYSSLSPLNLTVVGGRVSGIGVAGLSLGGGR